MQSVSFQAHYTVRDLRLDTRLAFSFVREGHEIAVALAPPSNEEQSRGHRPENASCLASVDRNIKPDIAEVFSRIEANAFGSVPTAVGSTRYPGPHGTDISIPGIDHFPQHFRSFINSVEDELLDTFRRTVYALRWRANQPGPHNPLSARGLRWSHDGSFWHPAPTTFRVYIEAHSGFRPSPEILTDTTAVVSGGGSSPLHHDLFREAWSQRHPNPRSAIVIGIAAAELGAKHLVATLVPAAEWLAFNVPSPPLVKILTEYLPTLPARHTFTGKVLAPPTALVDSLRKGVTIRNQLAHAGGPTLSTDTVIEILESVRDVLWLLDYYEGHAWALTYMSETTRRALGAA